MNKEDKIIKIDTLLVNRRRELNCKCENPSYEIDTKNHLLYCRKCMAVVEPFVALLHIAMHWEELNDKIQYAKRYRNELMNYKPYLREAKRYEKMMRQKDMLPICPYCKEPFEWREINQMTNKKFYRR